MTENKRFMIEKSSIVEDGFFIYDTTGKFSFPTTKDKSELIMYVKHLNELNNENEQLKQTNQELYDKLQVTMSEKSLKGGEVSILKRENEELKHELKTIKNILFDLKEIESYWDSSILQNVIDNIAETVGVDLDD